MANLVSYETYAPRSSKQRDRLSRIADLTAGPEKFSLETPAQGIIINDRHLSLIASLSPSIRNSAPENTNSNSEYGGDEFTPADEGTMLTDDYQAFLLLRDDSSAPSSHHQTSGGKAREITERSKTLTQQTTQKMKENLDSSTLLCDNLQSIMTIAMALNTKHSDLLKHSGELAQQCERLQREEQLLSEHAKEIGLPLQHYDSIDQLATKVGVLFKERNGQSVIIKGLARINVDSEEYAQVLDDIDEAMQFFVLGQGRIGAQGMEYGKRSTALHEAALGLIKEAVIDRILQTTRDVQAALHLPKVVLHPDKLEASLVYTRFHGVSSRSNSLLNILQLRSQRPIAPQTYIPLLQQCQSVFCNSRHLLLNHSVRKNVEQLHQDHGLVGMTRLACVFLMRVCGVESALYLDFFGIPPSKLKINKSSSKKEYEMNGDCQKENNMTDNDSESDGLEEKEESRGNGGKYNVSSRSMVSIYGGKNSATRKKNKATPFLDDEPFQKMLATTVCSHLHRVIRRGVVLLSDMDLLCQVVSVLREERSTANSSVHTRSLARSISAMIEDAQERLIFCTQNVLTKEVVKFHPSPSDVDYPNRLLQQRQPSVASSAMPTHENDEGDSILQAQIHLYESWFPPMRTVLKVLSKIFRVVEPRVFEDIALQAVQACTSSLKDAANTVRVVSGILDSDLFLVKHLLILREQLSPFDIELRAVERQLDFSEAGKAVTKFLANRNRRIFSMSTENALVTLLREGVSIQESSVDSKRDLEDALRSACNNFIEHSSQKVATPLFNFVDQCKSVESAPNSSLQTQSFMAPAAINKRLAEAFDTFEKEAPPLKKQMGLYLQSSVTQNILLKPVARKLLRSLEDVKKIVACTSADDDSTDKEQVFVVISNMESVIKEQMSITRITLKK